MFLSFVHKLKTSLISKNSKWLVIGNESADLDSVVGCLVYAFCMQLKNLDTYDVIPVCCIPKNSMNLKRDVIKWLDLFGIDPINDVVFLEDVHDILFNEETVIDIKITLIDHHKPLLSVITKYVREIIDHRLTVYSYPVGQLTMNNVELVGSCCTLIKDYVTNDISHEDRIVLYKLLHGVILLDTDCLFPNNGKTTIKDVDTVVMIESFVGMDAETRIGVYNILSQAKSDISGFTIEQLVKRDLKILDYSWNNMNIKLAIPTLINIDIVDLLNTENLEDQLKDILNDLNANFFIGLTCGNQSRGRRGYLIYSNFADLNDAICQHILKPEYKLQLHPLVHKTNVKTFYENDLRTSRKIFIPIIDKFFNSIQTNNSYIVDDCDTLSKVPGLDIVVDSEEEHELEGAPYTLNTPLRSYSGSPDNRTTEISLPSLNNRHTLRLVDHKRQKHHAELNEEMSTEDDNELVPDKINADDASPRIFTPENSDDESSSYSSNNDKDDDVGPLPTFKQDKCPDHIKPRRRNRFLGHTAEAKKKSESFSKKVKLSSNSASELKSGKISDFNEDDTNQKDFNSLTEKVNKKRQKLQSSHITSVARSLVNDVLNSSENIVIDEINISAFLDDWSECYSEDEKKQILNCVANNDMHQLAHLLTSCLIKDCLEVPDTLFYGNGSEGRNDAAFKLQEYFDSDSLDDPDGLDNLFPVLETNYGDCHMGNIINEENQCILANNVNSSSADVVENISFNLYRRISTNQLNYSEDEKELLMSAGDWLPKEDVIYSDPEFDEQTEFSNRGSGINNSISLKIMSLDRNICMDASTNSL